MKYRNKTDKDQWIPVSMCKRRVPPGGTVNLSIRDINHAGSNLRNFEQVVAAAEQKRIQAAKSKPVKEEPATDNTDYETPPESDAPEVVDDEKQPETPVESEEAAEEVSEEVAEEVDGSEEAAEEVVEEAPEPEVADEKEDASDDDKSDDDGNKDRKGGFMRYINSSEDRRLVVIRMIKKWVSPGQVVDLNSADIRMLGANGAFMRPATEDESKVAKQAPVAAPPAEKKAEPKKSDGNADRKAMKDSLDEYTKSGLVDIAESLGIEVKSKDNKAALTKKIMAAAKKVGYANAVKKAGI